MKRGEIQAAGDLAGDALGGIGGIVRDVHGNVAERVFGLLGPLSIPARPMHDLVSRAVYAGVGNSVRFGIRAGAAAYALTRDDSVPSVTEHARGKFAVAALNGAVGDVLTEQYPELALDMTVRCDGRDITVDALALAEAFPHATNKVVVFAHGLGETDTSWRLGGRPTYGSRLAGDLDFTPVHLSYNTGLHISQNGRAMAALLDALHGSWPVPVDDLVLIGHSMGGLVTRSACHYGAAQEHAWTTDLTHVICLGTPHLGAPLEQFANVGGWLLGRLPETRPFADVVNGRSVGIKDLRFGACVDEDWADCDPDEFLKDRCTEVPFLPHATYCFVGASLGKREGDLVDRLIGDLLVLYTSSSGAGKKRKIPFEADYGRRMDGVNHFQLLNHPQVYEHVRSWLGGAPPSDTTPEWKQIPARR
jgi:pimeloyl-ACP methyl ester carboxylesterase